MTKRCFHKPLLILLTFMPTAVSAQTAQLQRAVVRIESSAGSTGTGFVVCVEKGTAYIVTAAHVVYGDAHPQISLFPRENVTYQATVINQEGADKTDGLALVELQGSSVQKLTRIDLDPEEPGTSDRITLIGFPRTGPPWSTREGTISGFRGSKVAFTASVDEGDSGGPLLKDGKAVGLVTEVSGQFGYAVRASALKSALSGWGFADCILNWQARATKDLADKDYPKAIRGLTEAINLNAQNAMAYHLRGQARLELGDYDGTLEDCKKALSIDQTITWAFNICGAAESKLGHYREAVEYYDQAIAGHETDRGFAQVFTNRGEAKLRLGERQGAITDLKVAARWGNYYAQRSLTELGVQW